MQTRAETGVMNPPRALGSNSIPRRASTVLPREAPPCPKGHSPFVDPTTASHSDVVASRPPSLVEENMALISARSSDSEDVARSSQIVPDRSTNETLHIISRDLDSHRDEGRLTSSEAKFLLLGDSEGDDLTTKKHRCRDSRVRSLGSKERTRLASTENVHIVHAPIKATEQMFEPEAVAKNLTAFEKRERMSRLRHRKKNLAIRRRRLESLSRGKRPSNLKELYSRKRVSVNITHLILNSEGLNIAAQMAAGLNLDSLIQWNRRLEDTDKNMSSERNRERTYQSSKPRIGQTAKPVKSCLAAQMAINNYFDMMAMMMLENVGHNCRLEVLQ